MNFGQKREPRSHQKSAEEFGSLPLVEVGSGDKTPEQTIGVDHQMAFASLIFLLPSKPMVSSPDCPFGWVAGPTWVGGGVG